MDRERRIDEDLRESPAYALWVASNAWGRVLRRALAPLDLTGVQYTVLAAVRRLTLVEGHVTQAEIVRFGALDPNMVSSVVRNLEHRGLLRRRSHPTDRRARVLVLTPAGERLAAEGRAAVLPALEAFFAPLAGEARHLARMLGKLSDVPEEAIRCEKGRGRVG